MNFPKNTYTEMAERYIEATYASQRIVFAQSCYSYMKSSSLFTDAEAQEFFFGMLGYKVRIK